MCDLLLKSAIAYKELAQYSYEIIGGRKNTLIKVEVNFPIDAYHHLAGFQYARIQALNEQKQALKAVLDGRVTYKQLISSGFKHSDRLTSIVALREMLESNQFVFHFRGHEPTYSKIKAEYLFVLGNTLFIVDDAMPVSIFESITTTDYSKKAPRFTVLQIKRRHIDAEIEDIVFRKTGFNEDN